MDTLNMFLVGTGSGAVLAIISMLLINAENAEQYPLGGFIPALWILADWGSFSQIEVAGILILGGMSGYYLLLTFGRKDLKFYIIISSLKIMNSMTQLQESMQSSKL